MDVLHLVITPGFGIAFHPERGGTAERLIQCADAAMYQAKRVFSGFAIFDGAAPG